MSTQGWTELLFTAFADVASTAVSTEQSLGINYTLPANYLIPGKLLRLTALGNISNVVTTPGTAIAKTKFGATVLAATAAFTPKTTVSTTLPLIIEAMVLCRAVGATGSAVTWGSAFFGNYDPAATTSIANPRQVMPTSGTGLVTINTTAAAALDLTLTFSVTTAAFTVQIASLEALN